MGLIVLRTPITQLLFQRGAFDEVSTARCAAVLLCYTIGLFAYSGQKIVASSFYAVQDAATPVKTAVVAFVANILFNILLLFPLKEAGLALSTSISGILQFGLLMFYYHKKIFAYSIKELANSFLRIFAASIGMGMVCAWVFRFTGQIFPSTHTLDRKSVV